MKLLRAQLCLALLAALLPTQRLREAPSPNPEVYEDPEAYAVYSALLSTRLDIPHGWEFAQSKRLIIQQELRAFPGETVKDLDIKGDKQFRQQWGTVLEDLVRKQQTPKLLVRAFPIEKPYELVSEKEIGRSFKDKGLRGWEGFYARYPGSTGYIFLSPVGFNREKTRAIVSVNHHCGSLCGGGTYYFLEKRGGKWVEVAVHATLGVWAS